MIRRTGAIGETTPHTPIAFDQQDIGVWKNLGELQRKNTAAKAATDDRDSRRSFLSHYRTAIKESFSSHRSLDAKSSRPSRFAEDKDGSSSFFITTFLALFANFESGQIRYFYADGSLALVHITVQATVAEAETHAGTNQEGYARFEVREINPAKT